MKTSYWAKVGYLCSEKLSTSGGLTPGPRWGPPQILRCNSPKPLISPTTLRLQQRQKVLAPQSFTTVEIFLAKSNTLENIHETKLLQPIIAFDEG